MGEVGEFLCQRCKKKISVEKLLNEYKDERNRGFLIELEKILPRENSAIIEDSKSSITTSDKIDLENIARIFEYFSDFMNIDHPLCTECSNNLNSELNDQIKEFDAENERYKKSILIYDTVYEKDIDEEILRVYIHFFI